MSSASPLNGKMSSIHSTPFSIDRFRQSWITLIASSTTNTA